MGYECLLAGLPDLKATSEAPMSMDALLVLLDETLAEKDKPLLALLRMKSDDVLITEQMEQYDDTIIGQPDWWEEDRKSVV